jgi:RNA polymerase sigma-70 factor (ECF subfamily)
MPQIARFSLSILQDEEQAADAVQETFLRLVQSVGRFNQRRSFRPWLFTLARRSCQDLQRKVARQLNKHQHFAEKAADAQGFSGMVVQEESAEKTSHIVAIDPAEDIRKVMVNREDQQLALDLLGELPDNAREIIILRIFDDLGFAEISQILNRPLSTVTSIYYRNVERLKQRFEECALLRLHQSDPDFKNTPRKNKAI